MSNKWKIFWAVSLVLVIFFQACGMHSWQELLISTADEKKMGREFDSLVRIKHKDVMQTGEELFSPSGDAQEILYNFYQARGKEVVGKITDSDFKSILTSEKLCRNDITKKDEKVACTKSNFFEFNIIKSNQLNAFAVPGGYVYFYTKILKDFRSESELISVLGHEVGHVIKHHSRDRMVKQAGAAALLDIFLGDGMAGVIGNVALNLALMNNGQEDESEADGVGFYFTNTLGISSYGLGDFFGRGLKTYDPEKRTCDIEEESSWIDALSTHPPSCKRVMDNTKKIKDNGQTFDTHPMNKNKIGNKTFTELVSAASL